MKENYCKSNSKNLKNTGINQSSFYDTYIIPLNFKVSLYRSKVHFVPI